MKNYIKRHKPNRPISPVYPKDNHLIPIVNGIQYPACPLFPGPALVKHLENVRVRHFYHGSLFSALRRNSFNWKTSPRS